MCGNIFKSKNKNKNKLNIYKKYNKYNTF